MRIILKELRMRNFKCFRDKTITFNDGVTRIEGKNGSGKTTIADAILFCLFGKNTMGQTNFELKTKENDMVIPRLEHSVELLINADGIEHTLNRSVKEVWIKKHGANEEVFKNNTTEYLVDGDTRTASEYKAFVNDLISEDIFKAITNPTYFTGLDWKVQRSFLEGLVDNKTIDIEDAVLKDALSKTPLENYLKSLATRIKAIKEKLEKIPTRLEELNKALPEKLDWDALEEELHGIISEIDETDKNINQIRIGNTSEVKRNELREKLRSVRSEIYNIETKAREEAEREREKVQNKVKELRQDFFETSKTINDLKLKIASHENLIKRCDETLAECEEKKLSIRERWSENQKRTLPLQESDQFCPTCGQPLPEEIFREKLDEMKKVFNENKANVTKKLTQEAAEVKKLISDSEELKSTYAEQIETDNKSVSIYNKKLLGIQAEIASLEKKEFTPNIGEAAQLKEDEENIKKEIENIGIDDNNQEQIDSLEKKKVELFAKRRELIEKIGLKSQYDKIQGLISEVENEQKDLIEQLSEKERQQDDAREYQDKVNKALEDEVNKKFTYCSWKLFKVVNNGGDPFKEPYCECYVDGVAFHDGLNAASRLNAGLDIINTLCKHYNAYAPIMIDNAESNLNILLTESQQVRLYVDEKDLFII